MAFRMTRPTIQGTEYHKASVLKAKAETVAQTRTAADPTLVAAGSELGRSYIPKAIDFTIKPAKIKIPEGDGKKKKGQSLDERLEKAEQGGETEEQYYDGMMDQILEKVPKKKKVQDKEYISPEPNQEDIDYAEELKRRSEELSAKRKQGDLDNSTRLDRIPIRPLPTTKAKEELFETTGSVANHSYQQDRFEKAAQEFGYDISTPEGYKEAEDVMEYNDRTDTWTNPRISVGEVEKRDPVENITVGTPTSITLDEEVAKNNAEIQAQIDAREALKLKKAKEKAEALQLKKDQEARELEEKNKAIREQNKVIVEAKKFYGITGDGKLTRSKLEEYQNMRILQEQSEANYKLNPIEIEEQSDREWNQAPPGRETVSNRSDLQKGGKYMDVDNDGTPDFIQKPTTTTTSQTTQNITTTKPKLSDFKDGKNTFGGHMSKNQAYDEAMKKWRRENPNPIQMRDDAIYKNAIKDGVVQKNMIKSGYKPLD